MGKISYSLVTAHLAAFGAGAYLGLQHSNNMPTTSLEKTLFAAPLIPGTLTGILCKAIQEKQSRHEPNFQDPIFHNIEKESNVATATHNHNKDTTPSNATPIQIGFIAGTLSTAVGYVALALGYGTGYIVGKLN